MKITELKRLRNYWYPVALETDTTPKLITLFGQHYVLWRSTVGPTLTQPYCPHRGARLDCGKEQGGSLTCAYHGWQFNADGTCEFIPQLDPGLPIPPKAHLKTYPVIERYGVFWTCIGTPETSGPPPWYEADELGWRVHVDFFEPWTASGFRIIDNNLDQSHPAFIHQTTFGDPTRPRVPRYDVEATSNGFITKIPQYVGGVGPQMGIDDEAQTFDRFQEAELLGPLHTRIRLIYNGAAPDYSFYGSVTPVDDNNSLYLRCSALSGDEISQPYGLFHAFSRRVVDEDRQVLELTNPDFPVSITEEVHLRCDRNTVEYRRILARLTKHEEPGIILSQPENEHQPSAVMQ